VIFAAQLFSLARNVGMALHFNEGTEAIGRHKHIQAITSTALDVCSDLRVLRP